MTEKQLLVYGARIRLEWFRKAEELGNVAEACRHYGVPRRTYYYWHSRWLNGNKQVTSLYDKPRTLLSHSEDVDEDTISLIVQLRFGLGYGEKALSYVIERDYGIKVSHHGVGNVLKRAELLEKRKHKVRKGRQLSNYAYYPGEVGQMDVKHWKRRGYQYDIIDCATRIKYKRIYHGFNPANTVDFLEHAVRFFAPAFTFDGIQTDNGAEFTYDYFPQVKPDTECPTVVWLKEHNIKHLRIPPSSPNLNGRVERPRRITIEAFDEDFEKFRFKCDGILARVIQHEFDHLCGIEFVEKIIDYKKIMNFDNYQKQIRTSANQVKESRISLIEYLEL